MSAVSCRIHYGPLRHSPVYAALSPHKFHRGSAIHRGARAPLQLGRASTHTAAAQRSPWSVPAERRVGASPEPTHVASSPRAYEPHHDTNQQNGTGRGTHSLTHHTPPQTRFASCKSRHALPRTRKTGAQRLHPSEPAHSHSITVCGLVASGMRARAMPL